MKKRLLVALLAIVLAVAMLPTIALADAEDIDTVEDEPLWEETWEDEVWDEDEAWYEDEAWDEDEMDFISPFPDVPGSADYVEAVARLADMGIFTGDDKGNFNPDANITRAETATIICRLMGVEDEIATPRHPTYDDVPTRHWASGYIAKATELGIFNGDGTGNFRPGDNVTYQEMIKMLVCMGGHEKDAQEAGGWPNGYIAIAKDLGITTGLRFDQTAKVPRSTVARLIFNSIL